MLKINLNTKKYLDYLLNLLVIILIIFFNADNMVFGANNSWFEVSKTPEGIQYIDKNSIRIKDKQVLEIKTKYLKIDGNTSKELEQYIYIMEINCLTNKFKDISVNGTKTFRAKWEAPNGDKLINDVISDSCKNV